MKKAAGYASEIAAGGGKCTGKDLVLRLREMSLNIGDTSSIRGDVLVGLVRAIEKSKDKDWDRKAVREAHYFIRAMVTPDGDPKGFTLRDQVTKRGITADHIKVRIIVVARCQSMFRIFFYSIYFRNPLWF